MILIIYFSLKLFMIFEYERIGSWFHVYMDDIHCSRDFAFEMTSYFVIICYYEKNLKIFFFFNTHSDSLAVSITMYLVRTMSISFYLLYQIKKTDSFSNKSRYFAHFLTTGMSIILNLYWIKIVESIPYNELL